MMASRQTYTNTYQQTHQPRRRKPTFADRPIDTPVAHADGFFPEGGRLSTYPFLGGRQKSAGESHLRLPARVCGAGATPRAMSTRSTVGTPASVAAELRLRDADKTARVARRVA